MGEPEPNDPDDPESESSSEDELDDEQGGDLSAGTQALPVGKIIETKVCRKDNPKVSQICIC